jgi:hypothetical protein
MDPLPGSVARLLAPVARCTHAHEETDLVMESIYRRNPKRRGRMLIWDRVVRAVTYDHGVTEDTAQDWMHHAVRDVRPLLDYARLPHGALALYKHPALPAPRPVSRPGARFPMSHPQYGSRIRGEAVETAASYFRQTGILLRRPDTNRLLGPGPEELTLRSLFASSHRAAFADALREFGFESVRRVLSDRRSGIALYAWPQFDGPARQLA